MFYIAYLKLLISIGADHHIFVSSTNKMSKNHQY